MRCQVVPRVNEVLVLGCKLGSRNRADYVCEEVLPRGVVLHLVHFIAFFELRVLAEIASANVAF